MGKTAFISVSFQQREKLAPTINKIADVLKGFHIDAKVFVNTYAFETGDEERMMAIACQEIAQSDLLIAEVSCKAIGVGVEVGYAVGLGKPIIYMRHKDAEHSTTVAGISKYKVVYSTHGDMEKQLAELLDVIF